MKFLNLLSYEFGVLHLVWQLPFILYLAHFIHLMWDSCFFGPLRDHPRRVLFLAGKVNLVRNDQQPCTEAKLGKEPHGLLVP